MKNFPHQINNIPRIVRCLQDYYDLEVQGRDINDDSIYGYAMARTRNYTFRGMADPTDDEIEVKITSEMQKKAGDQGARTCARDLRRMFILLNFIDPINHRLTRLGLEILEVGDDLSSDVAKELWRSSLLDIGLYGVDDTLSHPYRILIRLLNENPGLQSEVLSLALEARDDSEAEFNRIHRLSQRDNWEEVLEEIGVSRNQARNAVKILPSFGKQIDDLRVESNLYYLSNREQFDAHEAQDNDDDGNGIVADGSATYQPRRSLRRATSENIANTQIDIDLDLERYNITVDLSSGIQARQERTVQHHGIVKQIAQYFEELGYQIYENQIDCLAVNADVAIIVEVKTLNGESKDERNQIMKALSQVYYYESFNLDEFSRFPTIKVACFSHRPSDVHIEFLEKNGCYVMWCDEDNVYLSDALREHMMN